MKLQHLAVIFVLIMIPIFLVLSEYIQMHVSTVQLEAQYSTKLMSSTHDAAAAFQVNTANNVYSTTQDSKMRDVEASVATFYNSLALAMGSDGYTKEELQLHTPAVLCTLYDGYYIHTKYNNTKYANPGIYNDGTNSEAQDHNSGNGLTDEINQYGLKPFIAYSCRYVKDSKDFVVNYTLDNTITIIGKVGLPSNPTVQRTGHLIQLPGTPPTYTELPTDSAELDDLDNYINTSICPGITSSENLVEYLVILNDNGLPEYNDPVHSENHAEKYKYIVYNSQKIYLEPGTPPKYFWYGSDYRKNYVSEQTWNEIKGKFGENFENNRPGLQYYREAVVFSNWVNKYLSDIKQENTYPTNYLDDEDNYSQISEPIFNTAGTNDNDPLASGSAFNTHRMNVIRKSITTNLQSVMKTFGTGLGIDFRMPKISEEEWYNIENNVTFVSFLQGIPMKNKIYNHYCVVSNNTNKESIDNDSIYIIAEIDTGVYEYHKPGCKKLAKGNPTYHGLYAASDFVRKSISMSGEDINAQIQQTGGGIEEMGRAFFYPQPCTPPTPVSSAVPCTACYDCIVNAADNNSTDKIILKEAPYDSLPILRQAYLKALARERYNLYTINGYFGN